MSSTIFYRFLHQKTQSTIHFDGTGINVFDLKHEIISQNQLGQGLDFNLSLYHSEQPDLEYENDQDVIPRSSFVLAKRLPPTSRLGRFGNASRYVSGKPRINRKTINNANMAAVAPQMEGRPMDENISEEDRIKLMFENQSSLWAQAQDELSTHKVVQFKPLNGQTAPEDVPPPGYMCYRCGGKDHWIKNCPTNTDPNFEGKKIKRTTGIPKSYLKTISKEAVERGMTSTDDETRITQTDAGELVDSKGNTYMITEEGDYVVTLADNKTWQTYQEKQQNAAMKAKQEFENQVLGHVIKDQRTDFLDPLADTQRLLRAPIVMTPCCQDRSKLVKMSNFNYHQPTLEQRLIDNDFHCPNCNKDDVFIDSLVRNTDLEKQLQEYTDQLGIKEPSAEEESGKRPAEDDPNDAKRQKIGMGMPDMMGLPFGMPPMPMPMPMQMPMPFFPKQPPLGPSSTRNRK